MIHNPIIPYSLEKNLVYEYNYEMSRIPKDDDFGFFLDHDVLMTTYFWKKQINEVVNKYPECSMFLATCNRLNEMSIHQRIANLKDTNDIEYHREVGQLRWDEYGVEIIDYSIPKPCHFSGFLMLIRKSLWKKIGGFKAWNEKSNILGIDSRLHQDLYEAGEKVYVMKGIYLYHWYRGGNLTNKKHLE